MRADAVLTIVAMGLVTYATRAGGVWLLGRVTAAPWVDTWLRAVPGALLMALVAPGALARGPAEFGAAVGAALVMTRTRNVLLAMAIGVGLVVALRGLG